MSFCSSIYYFAFSTRKYQIFNIPNTYNHHLKTIYYGSNTFYELNTWKYNNMFQSIFILASPFHMAVDLLCENYLESQIIYISISGIFYIIFAKLDSKIEDMSIINTEKITILTREQHCINKSISNKQHIQSMINKKIYYRSNGTPEYGVGANLHPYFPKKIEYCSPAENPPNTYVERLQNGIMSMFS